MEGYEDINPTVVECEFCETASWNLAMTDFPNIFAHYCDTEQKWIYTDGDETTTEPQSLVNKELIRRAIENGTTTS